MNLIKSVLLRIVYGHKSTSERYVNWLRKQGIRVGECVHFYSPWTIKVDTQRPWMVEIGNHVHIAADCSILQHDYSWAVIQYLTGKVLGASGNVRIGDNVFIGQKTLILRGADIGDNTIIGAGSVVTGKLEGNAVYAGVPAKKIVSLQEFIKKRDSMQLNEAVQLVQEYEKVYAKRPDKQLLREFFWLFEPRMENLDLVFQQVNELDGNKQKSTSSFLESEPLFKNYDDFVEYAEQNRSER